MKAKFIFLCFIILMPFKVLLSQEDKQNEILYLIELANNNLNENKLNQAADEINQAIQLLPLITSTEIKANAYLTAAIIYAQQKENDLALVFYFNAADNFEKLEDSLTVSEIYNQIALLYFSLEAYNKALEYFKNALNIRPAENVSFDFVTTSLEYRANCYFNINDFLHAELLFKELLTHFSNKEMHLHAINTLHKLIASLEKQRKYEAAIEFHLKLKDLYLKQNHKNKITEVFNNIGCNFVLIKNYEDAKNAFLQAEKKISEGVYNKDFEATLYTNIGICYQNVADYRNAISYLLKALRIKEDFGNHEETAAICNILALVYFRSDDLYNALEYSIDAINEADKTKNAYLQSQCYLTYSTILQATEDYQKALDYYKKHLFLQDSILRKERIHREQLNERIMELERFEKELKLKIAEENVKDILLEQLKLKAIQREQENEILRKEKALQESEKERIEQSLILARQQNEALRRDREIQVLEKEKRIAEQELRIKDAQEKEQAQAYELLKAEKEKQSLEMQKQELTLEKQAEREKRFGWMMALALVIIVLIVVFLLITRRKNKTLSFQKDQIEQKNDILHKQKEEIQSQAEHLKEANTALIDKNEEIEVQKQLIEKKNISITAGITYASYIQNAVLNKTEILDRHFPDNFILFKPCEIVSGDFYFIKEVNNHIVIAAADCTGHGVSGAFMSVLSYMFLNEVVVRKEITKANNILDELRKLIKDALQQKGHDNEQRDGLDIAVVVINLDTLVAGYAGAYNPLVILKKDNKKEFIKYAGDRQPIGIYRKEQPFSYQELQLQKGDQFYIYSDGYYSQFGGDSGRTMKSSRMKEVILSVAENPMWQQKNTLEQEFNEWRGSSWEQIDDVLIIGVRV